MSISFNDAVINEYRANGGKISGPLADSDLLLLTTTGARSKKQHTVALGYVHHEGLLLIVGSYLGAPRHPDWYHNLLAHPEVRVELGDAEFDAIAVPAEGDRRDQLFAAVVRAAPGYGDYQANTARELPVVVLERWETPAAARRTITTLADKILEIHAWLRAQLSQVRAETEAYFAAREQHPDPAFVPSLGMQIRQHCLAFCGTLEFHHTSEDAHIFPVMAGYHPHLREAFDRLGTEHLDIARIKEDLVALLRDITSADPHRFRDELDGMARRLLAHLDYEESVLVPLLADVPFPPVHPQSDTRD
ncbi:nitroreductase/quinone reductase family protein [Actinoalloteichus hymeniacidonis]|uniref:Deazaflavin-dependent oxidoreductase, nitroreductase family n=1 Tax=Actinoalloteichus hymeniacidonis TaxID=340345 RepID=A0AAC9HQP4_9PSEU|nr:nitroreductase/quinone reductase family protein [Actinoalloteichus hymeniacidonis]AOS63639.1 deazaflavin-dependent oxidoreductase, nitroreductase family [Actinoalloteichus hymeniacidonis]MBB5908313.1 deazaflavin-dependent oxidoreductase (nitroreductase family) [Actinoalloteichus hymeniacidonis]